MRVGIVSDHRGYLVKDKLVKYLKRKGYIVFDYGTTSTMSVDYPDYAFILGEKYNQGEFDLGIAICGTGIGISIACNKVKGIRCAKVDSVKEAKLAREHNNANLISFNANKWMFDIKDIVDAFLKTPFSNVERHKMRIDKISSYESKGE